MVRQTGDAMIIAPPLVSSTSEIDSLVDILVQSIDDGDALRHINAQAANIQNALVKAPHAGALHKASVMRRGD